MSVNEGKAVALAAGGRFLQIRDRNFHVGQEIMLEPSMFPLISGFPDRISLRADILRRKTKRLADRLKYRGMIIMAGILVLVPSTAYAGTKYIPWTYVSLDTGSVSVQYQLNARGEVLSSNVLGGDGAEKPELPQPVRFEKIEDAVERTMAAIPGVPEGDTPVFIGVSTRFGDGNGTAENVVSGIERVSNPPYEIGKLDWAEAGKAREEALSIGQYIQRRERPAEIPEKPEAEPLPEAPVELNDPEPMGDPAKEPETGAEHPYEGQSPAEMPEMREAPGNKAPGDASSPERPGEAGSPRPDVEIEAESFDEKVPEIIPEVMPEEGDRLHEDETPGKDDPGSRAQENNEGAVMDHPDPEDPSARSVNDPGAETNGTGNGPEAPGNGSSSPEQQKDHAANPGADPAVVSNGGNGSQYGYPVYSPQMGTNSGGGPQYPQSGEYSAPSDGGGGPSGGRR